MPKRLRGLRSRSPGPRLAPGSAGEGFALPVPPMAGPARGWCPDESVRSCFRGALPAYGKRLGIIGLARGTRSCGGRGRDARGCARML